MLSITNLLLTLRSLRDDERGASAIEYALVAAGIAVAVAALIPGIREQVTNIFTSIQTGLANAQG